MENIFVDEFEPLPILQPSVSAYTTWIDIIGHKGYHVSLKRNFNIFGIDSVFQKLHRADEDVIEIFKNSMQIVAGIKAVGQYGSDVTIQPHAFVNMIDFDLNQLDTWIPKNSKFATSHHYGIVNMIMALYLQRESDEAHSVECAICHYSDIEDPVEDITGLYKHGINYHVKPMIPAELYGLTMASDLMIPKFIGGEEFMKDMNFVYEAVKKQIVKNLTL